jgi:hypothetical protein
MTSQPGESKDASDILWRLAGSILVGFAPPVAEELATRTRFGTAVFF